MKKWITYLVFLAVLIVASVIAIVATKASFMEVVNVDYQYKAVTVAEKFIETRYHSKAITPFVLTSETIPSNLQWLDGMEGKIFASPKAKRGGTYNTFLTSFPQTFRQVGTNANGSFRGELDKNKMYLTDVHPDTLETIPSLAKQWAFGDDKRTVYYRLDPDARWSDGVPVTADDFIFMLKFMRSKGIVSAWYNEYFSTQIEDILKFDNYTIAVRLSTVKPNLLISTNMAPLPHHFYGDFTRRIHKVSPSEAFRTLSMQKKNLPKELQIYLVEKELQKSLCCSSLDESEKVALKEKLASITKQIKELNESDKTYELELEDVCESWNSVYNWKPEPNTGAYQLHSFMHGKWIMMKRNNKWWADKKKYYSFRFNPDFIKYHTIADPNIAFEYFKQNKLDAYGLNLANYWYKKANDLSIIEKGYTYKTWYWNDIPRPSRLLTMNMANERLQDINVRLGIAHSLNFRKMIDNALLGDAVQADTIAEGYGEYENNLVKARKYDPVLAGKYFVKAGYDRFNDQGIRINHEGKLLKFNLLYVSDVEKSMLLVIKEEASKAGLKLVLDTFDGNTVFTRMLKKEHELAWHGWSPGSIIIGPRFEGEYHGMFANKPSNNNFANLNDPSLDKMIDLFKFSDSEKQRIELSKQIIAKIHDHACSIPSYYVPFTRNIFWRWLRIPKEAQVALADGPLFTYSWWIDTDMKEETLKAMDEKKTFKKVFRVFTRHKPVND